MKIYSEIGVGTTVKLYLPRYHGADLPKSAEGESNTSEKGRSHEVVLVVEDVERVRNYSVEALQERVCRGIGLSTSNGYLTAIKGFSRWLVEKDRTDRDRLISLSRLNAKTDLRHERRALPEAEERQARAPQPVRPTAPFPVALQEALCRRLSERLGLDFARARVGRRDERANQHARRRGDFIHGTLELRVGIEPARLHLRLPDRRLHVRGDAIAIPVGLVGQADHGDHPR